ncbi:MAG: HypC/HybG/HupF family hydrogenase formation chaperone [Lachnospiraceae bacterium]|nr:HypC/HybG/HupF family hydrogenase formation chaperone [Lachnospiraceae bacterium]
MCVALPGRIKKVNEDNTAIVDFSGNEVNAMTGVVEVKEGDRVLVHAGCVIQKISDDEADNMESLFNEINSMFT